MNDLRPLQFAHALGERELHESEERFRSVLALSSGWYWEQNEQFRFTRLLGGVFERRGIEVRRYLGKTR